MQRRVLEEFTFYSIVRTSLEIKAYAVQEEEVTLESILDASPFTSFPLFESIKSDPVKTIGNRRSLFVNTSIVGGNNITTSTDEHN
ncbi:MAG: hypothetical protein EOP48_01580 [Sphingobacteriales bacterium]|nr:MAG: hypothetical protein EOP48_01580 [Sphingobacteriales bacterium]